MRIDEGTIQFFSTIKEPLREALKAAYPSIREEPPIMILENVPGVFIGRKFTSYIEQYNEKMELQEWYDPDECRELLNKAWLDVKKEIESHTENIFE